MKTKKTLCIILAAVMLICSLSLGAFAAEEAPHYVVLGDSIAYGSGLSNPREACYGKIVADTNGYSYVNHAIPGHTTTNLLKRLEEETVAADVARADIISISIGGNDFLMNNLFGLIADALIKEDYSKFDAIADGFYSNFCRIVERINALNADAVILMQTIYNPQTGHIRNVYQQGADRLNAQMLRYSEEHPGEIILVDIATALSDTMDNFADDDIHPSALGNEKIAVAVLETLKANGLGTNTQPVITTKGEDFRIPETFTKMLDIMGTVYNAIGVVYRFFVGLLEPIINLFK